MFVLLAFLERVAGGDPLGFLEEEEEEFLDEWVEVLVEPG